MKAEMTNEKIPTVDVPQTGDNSMTGFWIGLGAIALGGLVALFIIRKKNKDDDREIDWHSPEQAEETTPPVQEM